MTEEEDEKEEGGPEDFPICGSTIGYAPMEPLPKNSFFPICSGSIVHFSYEDVA